MDMGIQEINRKIIDEFRANQGKVGGQFEGATLLLLTTTGAKSGLTRTNPLAYLRDGRSLRDHRVLRGRDDDPPLVLNRGCPPDGGGGGGSEELPRALGGAGRARTVRVLGEKGRGYARFFEIPTKEEAIDPRRRPPPPIASRA